jgi:hypothetical protein
MFALSRQEDVMIARGLQDPARNAEADRAARRHGGFVGRLLLVATAPLAASALSGCRQADTVGNEAAAPAAAQPSAAPAPAPAPAQPTVPNAACAPPPRLDLSDDFADPSEAFARDSAVWRQTAERFDAAYRRACASGIMRGGPLIEPGASHPDRLFLKNAPEANIASIYREGGEGGEPGDMILEYPFLTAGNATHAPTGEELEEAIFCSVHGASDKEAEESGRCLPD